MALMVIGCIGIFMWGAIYVVLGIFSNASQKDVGEFALVITDIIIVFIGASIGGWGIVAALLFCVMISGGIKNSFNQTTVNNVKKKTEFENKNDEYYGIIEWKYKDNE